MYRLLLTITLLFAATLLGAQSLTNTDRQTLLAEIATIAEMDGRHRAALSLGTLDPELLRRDAELSKNGTLEELLAFERSVEETLTDAQRDSLWTLQHRLDAQNYRAFKRLVQRYGYPSKERLGVKSDRLFAVLLHPPVEIEPQAFLDEMTELLLPEVQAGRMAGKSYALFVDNIKAKVLREPQLYGTNRSFDLKTMAMGPPEIVDLEITNAARAAIGLEPLAEAEVRVLR